jgi:hypothetical protein
VLRHPRRPSSLRKFRDSAPDPKYDAVKIQRNKIFDDDDEYDSNTPREQADLAAFLEPGDDVSDVSDSFDDEEEEEEEGDGYRPSKPFDEIKQDSNEDDDDDEGDNDERDDNDSSEEESEREENEDNGRSREEIVAAKKPEGDSHLAEMLRNSRAQDALKGAALLKQQVCIERFSCSKD